MTSFVGQSSWAMIGCWSDSLLSRSRVLPTNRGGSPSQQARSTSRRPSLSTKTSPSTRPSCFSIRRASTKFRSSVRTGVCVLLTFLFSCKQCLIFLFFQVDRRNGDGRSHDVRNDQTQSHTQRPCVACSLQTVQKGLNLLSPPVLNKCRLLWTGSY